MGSGTLGITGTVIVARTSSAYMLEDVFRQPLMLFREFVGCRDARFSVRERVFRRRCHLKMELRLGSLISISFRIRSDVRMWLYKLKEEFV